SQPSTRDLRMRRGDGRAHRSMTVREREREHGPKHGGRETVQRPAARDGELDPVLVKRLRRADRLEQMRVPPHSEGTAYLLVAESPAGDVAVVPKRPTHPQGTDANRHGDASAVADAARLLFDPHEAR